MRSPLRLLAMTLVVGLLGAGSAQAAIIGVPEFTLSPFTKAQTGAGNAVTTTLTWLPPTFSPPSATDKQEITVTDLDGGSPQTFAAAPAAASFPLILSDGHRYSITVAACSTATCVLGSVNTAELTGTTRIDATPPSGTVQVNGGAVATNNRTVTLNLTATDPLIGGVPGTSSGVTQSATDVDGDGSTPCILFATPPDSSGCAVPFAPTVPATIPAGGDGVKTLGVQFGDGARVNTSPCPPGIFCAIFIGSFIVGNASPIATDTILLDTVKPIALFTQDRFTIDRGGSVSFDATTSVDQSPATASGVDLTTATWQFKDGTAQATGGTVTHVFNQVGTFVGELRVRDRAGNLSDVRPFSVTVNPGPGSAASGGSVSGIAGTAAFKLDRLKVRARYVQSRLKGSIAIRGSSTRAGALRAELRRTARGRLLGRIVAKKLKVGAFGRTLKLPANLLPGTYRLAFIGPGGTLRTTLKLIAPREGVLKRERVVVSGGGAVALFTLASQPAKALRGRLTVSWSQGSRKLGQVSVTSGALIRAALPAGASLATGRLRAVLRAGGIVVGRASVSLR